ncbi:MAG TPA: ATP-dependent DNA helicase RecG [Phycisphaerales bacterium]|nr:ATP-dependent DNA helicase RecG [Phycisphaerales bacterium]HRQ74553.1 ATP-dependent DNA helicase RecG [Phycisphaerales bacterium]
MPASASIRLTTAIADVPGVGNKRAEGFHRLGIRSVADLIRHVPMRYEHELEEQPIGQANAVTVPPVHGSEANLAVQGEVLTTRTSHGRRARFEATIYDGTGTMLLTWFNAPWMRGRLHPGATIRAWGKTKRWGDYLQMVNPRWEELKPDTPEAASVPRAERFRPIYPSNEDVSSSMIEKAVESVLDAVLPLLDDHLHEDFRRAKAMPTFAEAYRMMHRPVNEEEISEGRRRLAFDELFMLQLGVMFKRAHRRETLTAPTLKHNTAIEKHITARFPFELTKSQREVIGEVVKDLTRPTPMNRLVQGDVGSGKTVVALYAMLMAAASGHQAALMAPTEILAEQHFASITQMLHGARVRIELLTGSLKPAERRRIHEALAAGAIDILIGTHALLTRQVTFKSLAVAVIDEQHRFGVHQRALLRTKQDAGTLTSPHMLVMTATPIPRTLSLTVFGDLDISTIRELPPGRQPITTRLVPGTKAGEVYRYVGERLDKGEQAYIVVPFVEESDSGLKDVQSHLDWLIAGPLAGRRLAAMHGRLKRDEREAVMDRFRAGEIDALVATTVIEVGVDVPNASLMVIEHADRFGLAQLHQLRGRIGRGAAKGPKSVCVLIADPKTEDGQARVEAIAATTDGFEIAEKDLEIRGPGELFGARQSGLAPFLVADLSRDVDLLRMARRDAEQWIDENPHLDGPRDALLRRRLFKAHGKALGLADVA